MLSHAVLGPVLVAVCVAMVVAAAAVYRIAELGSPWTAPRAAVRAVAQLAVVSFVLAAAMARLWSSVLVLVVMFCAATVTAARRSSARGSWLLVGSLAAGLMSVVPILLGSGLVPLAGVSIVPVVGIILGGAMTATAVAARRAASTLCTSGPVRSTRRSVSGSVIATRDWR